MVITNAGASVLLTNSTEYLRSLVISNTATLVFSNWNTTLSATNVYIRTNATVTLPGAFTTSQMSNNVYIVCSNLTVDGGGKINADSCGYLGGVSYASGYGPGAGQGAGGYGGGGGNGGYGGGSWAYQYGGVTYGSTNQPLYPGSGGGSGAGSGGAGGGAVRITAEGTVTINGTITANGGNYGSVNGAGGSGGSIYLTCWTLAGTNGVLSANGGKGNGGSTGDGGGGRIAVGYNLTAQGAAPVPTIRFSAAAGNSSLAISCPGDLGTLYFPDTRFLTETVAMSGQIVIPGFTQWSPNTLMVSNQWIRFPGDGFQLNVTQDAWIMGAAGRLDLGGAILDTNAYTRIYAGITSPTVLNVGGNLILTNSGSLVIYCAMTNAGPGTMNYGALVSVTNDLITTAGSWIYPQSHPTNGGSVRFRMKNLIVSTNSGINADGLGFIAGYSYRDGRGPGAGRNLGSYGTGGGYGGYGGGSAGSLYGGLPCGSTNAPIDPGSGAGSGAGSGGHGGGAIWVEANETVTVNGSLTANGKDGSSNGGGGSGGGIYIACKRFAGTNGLVSANGGKCGSPTMTGDGGGGRISVRYDATAQNDVPVPAVLFSAIAGPYSTSYPGDLGTLYLPDTRFLNASWLPRADIIIPVFTSWAQNALTITNWTRFSADGFQLTVTQDLQIVGSLGRLELGGPLFSITNVYKPTRFGLSAAPILAVGGNLLVTNGGALVIYSAPTNSGSPKYGALVSVAGNVAIRANSWIYPCSHPTNGGSVIFRMRNLTVETNAGFNAFGRGFAGGADGQNGNAGYGPGHGFGAGYGSSGGYGGVGGCGYVAGGVTYGSSNAPVDAGSGGGVGTSKSPAGHGGGSIWVEAASGITLNGTLMADGHTPITGSGGNAGAGSGGGIYLTCKKFIGSSTGLLTAKGGEPGYPSYQAGGGGGRIAVWRILDLSSGQVATNVAGGSGTYGGAAGPGTVVWGWLPPPGTVFVIH